MPDITKCPGEGCDIRETCYRFTSKASQWQSYSQSVFQNGKCEDYWPTLKAENVIQKSSFDYEAEYRAKLNSEST